MKTNRQELLKFFSTKSRFKLLQDSKHGLERETLRITPKATLAKTPHYTRLFGSALTNPYISTDFAEQQLELITPTYKSESAAIRGLKDIHTFIAQRMKDELFWPASMPSKLPRNENKIELATYGNSQEGQKRTIYRRGLGHRYGRKMQTICGIHYNFSFSDKLMNELYKKFVQPEQMKKEFVTETYFSMIRNFLELSWLDNYLFGAHPAVHKSYLNRRPAELTKFKDAYYGEYATTLRMSKFGYCCTIQSLMKVCFNCMNCYIRDLKKAVSTPHEPYTKIGLEKRGVKLQLNDHLLQMPNEYYAVIRPKQNILHGQNFLKTLERKGVRYLEVRTVDINPFDPVGVKREHLQFLHMLLAYCLIKEDQYLKAEDQVNMIKNHDNVALLGRKPGLTLIRKGRKVKLTTWGLQIMEDMKEVAELLDKNHKDQRYSKTLERQRQKFLDSEKTPSAKVLKSIKESGGYLKFYLKLANEHTEELKNQKLLSRSDEKLTAAINQSLVAKSDFEQRSGMYLDGYEDLEISTQMLIKEALNRKVRVEILDRKANFIKLSQGRKNEYIIQATKTAKDSYMSYLLMENKELTKIMLQRVGISVPRGGAFDNPKDALNHYPSFAATKHVIKPADTNFGISINFTVPNDFKSFEYGVNEAFKHGDTAIIEEFVEGKEYRFLVINGKVVSVVHREPAHVVGDGKHTIRELVDLKNHDPKNLRAEKEYLKIGTTEIQKLSEQKMQASSMPKKSEKVYLRDNSNVSTGGDAIEMSNEIDDDYKKIALKAAQAVDAKICGIDMIIQDIGTKPTKANYSIIELNFNPILKIHKFPNRGEGKDVEKALLDFLGF